MVCLAYAEFIFHICIFEILTVAGKNKTSPAIHIRIFLRHRYIQWAIFQIHIFVIVTLSNQQAITYLLNKHCGRHGDWIWMQKNIMVYVRRLASLPYTRYLLQQHTFIKTTSTALSAQKNEWKVTESGQLQYFVVYSYPSIVNKILLPRLDFSIRYRFWLLLQMRGR